MGIRNMKTVTVDGIIYKVPMDIKKDVLKIVAAWPDGSCKEEAPIPESSKNAVTKATEGIKATLRDVRTEMRTIKSQVNKLPNTVKAKYFS